MDRQAGCPLSLVDIHCSFSFPMQSSSNLFKGRGAMSPWTHDWPWYEVQVNPVTGVWLFARYTLLVNRRVFPMSARYSDIGFCVRATPPTFPSSLVVPYILP